jgi:hypothetical protein
MRSTSISRWRAEASLERSLSISASVADVGAGGLDEDDAEDIEAKGKKRALPHVLPPLNNCKDIPWP